MRQFVAFSFVIRLALLIGILWLPQLGQAGDGGKVSALCEGALRIAARWDASAAEEAELIKGFCDEDPSAQQMLAKQNDEKPAQENRKVFPIAKK